MTLWSKRLDDRNWLLSTISTTWALLALGVVACSLLDDRYGFINHRTVDFVGWTMVAVSSIFLFIVSVRELRIDIGLVPTRTGVLGEPTHSLDPKMLFSTAMVALFAVAVLAITNDARSVISSISAMSSVRLLSVP